MEEINNSRDYNRWSRMYPLVKIYYDYYGNLDIQSDFKTKNGYERDDDGEYVGAWIRDLRTYYNGKGIVSLDKDKIEKLNAIGMIWDVYQYRWNKMYLLAKIYYDYHGDLDIPNDFKTKNGYERDDDGVSLGTWIRDLRSVYHGNKNTLLDEERIKKLNAIGMIWDIYQYRWNKKYLLAKAFYDHNSHLDIKSKFKTLDGYTENSNGVNMGNFIQVQRKRYLGFLEPNFSDEQLLLLEDIRMLWFIKKNKFYQEEIITDENKSRKQIEIYNRLRSYLNKFSHNNALFCKEELNQCFLHDLEGKYFVKK